MSCFVLQEGDSSHNTTTTPPDSTESSVEGIYVSGVRSLHPFKVVDYDSRSVVSETRSAASRSLSGQHELVELRSSGARAGPLTARNSEDIFLSPPPAATKFPPVFQPVSIHRATLFDGLATASLTRRIQTTRPLAPSRTATILSTTTRGSVARLGKAQPRQRNQTDRTGPTHSPHTWYRTSCPVPTLGARPW